MTNEEKTKQAFNDWAKENEREAYEIVLTIAKALADDVAVK